MRNGPLQNTGPFVKLVFSAFIVISVFLATLLGGLLLAIPLFGLGFIELFESLSNIAHPRYLDLLRYFQVVQSIGLFVIPPFILAWFFGGSILGYLNMDRGISRRAAILTVLVMLSAIPLINLLAWFNAQLSLPEALSGLEEWMKTTEETAENLIKSFLRVDTVTGLFVNLVMIAVIPAVGEELLFRGVIQRLFSEWTRSHHLGIWIAAIIFSAMHLQFYGFLPRTVLGALFGYLLVWSGTMWVPVLAHFVNNAAAVFVYYFIYKNQLSEEIETIGAGEGDWIYALASVLVFTVFIGIFYSKEKRQSPTLYRRG
ncbi:MAG: CPBP family intramembrane metalloprotease [Marinilabiliales bacterium]|nr:MAG: CPBP family intramembrane metalloprotease [Marinilabiliales bacterium]